jgi:hypothetical protein
LKTLVLALQQFGLGYVVETALLKLIKQLTTKADNPRL